MSSKTKLDYLKKYLSSDKKKSKKKKKDKIPRINIIDDNEFEGHKVDADDILELAGEDAPQIANLEEFNASADKKTAFVKSNWQNLSEDPKDIKKLKQNSYSDDYNKERRYQSNESSPMRRDVATRKTSLNPDSDLSPKRISNRVDSDISPVRKRNGRDNDISPRRKNSPRRKTSKTNSDSDLSPRRISRRRDSDLSPLRKYNDSSKRVNKRRSTERKNSRTRDYSPKNKSTRFNADSSPRRKNFNENYHSRSVALNSDSDLSPKRISDKRADSDISPVRKRKDRDNDISPRRKNSPQRKICKTNSDSDLSPQRISRRRDLDLSSLRKNVPNKYNDISTTDNKHTERKTSRTRDYSPKKKSTRFNDTSPRRKKIDDDYHSPSRSRWNRDNGENSRYNRNSSNISPERQNYKNMKDSDNNHSTKRLGFQDSSTLKNENKNLKAQQDEVFQDLYERSNNDEPNVRQNSRRDDKRLKHDPQKELELKKKLETYRKWGKGLKQIEDYKSKQIDEINTGNKPLARYSNDQDLEEMLKNTERSGDPMLEYLRKNKTNKNPDAPSIPVYKGPMPQNRFNIRPGYRWDGVDRSSGYEQKLFDVKNQRLAMQEEAYKYSTEDM